jgi:hypothetical protein
MGQARGKPRREEERRGLECPRCGCRHLPVLYTRQGARRIVRVRECRHCGRRVVTYESISAWRIAIGGGSKRGCPDSSTTGVPQIENTIGVPSFD